MSIDHYRYDLLTQEAMRGVVRRVLTDAARDGLPGEHHFFISFKTQYPGVSIPGRLAEKFPEELTIVLQHQFWDLIVNDYGFEVGLSFGNAPERLSVPFEALTGFFDPSVSFGLKFEVAEIESTGSAAPSSSVQSSVLQSLETAGGGQGEVAPASQTSEGVDMNEPEPGGAENVVRLDRFRKRT